MPATGVWVGAMGDSGILRAFFNHQTPLTDHAKDAVVDGDIPSSLTEVVVGDLIAFNIVRKSAIGRTGKCTQDETLLVFVQDVDRRIGKGVRTIAQAQGVKNQDVAVGASLNIFNNRSGSDSDVVAAKALIHFGLIQNAAVTTATGRWGASSEADKALSITTAARLTCPA